MVNKNIEFVLNTKKITEILNILSILSSKITSLIAIIEIRCDKNKLKFLISNDVVFCENIYDSTIQSEDFSFIVDISKLFNIVRNCPGNTISMKYYNNIVNITSLSTNFTINTLTNTKIITPNISDYLIRFEILAQSFASLINYVEFCALKNNLNSNLNAIALQYKAQEKKLIAIGIDGHRLGISTLNINIEKDFNILIPLQVIQKIPSFLSNILDSKIYISITNTNLILESQDKKGLFALMNQDSSFPPYHHLIPSDNNNIITCDPIYFTNILKRVTSISTESIKSVRIELSSKQTIIHTKELNDNHNHISKEVIIYNDNFSYKGVDIEIALNADYLIQFLNKVKNSTINIYIKDSSTAVLLTCKDYLQYIVMPLKI